MYKLKNDLFKAMVEYAAGGRKLLLCAGGSHLILQVRHVRLGCCSALGVALEASHNGAIEEEENKFGDQEKVEV